MATAAAEQMEIDEQKIDEGLYSRQLCVLRVIVSRCPNAKADARSSPLATCLVMKVTYYALLVKCLQCLCNALGSNEAHGRFKRLDRRCARPRCRDRYVVYCHSRLLGQTGTREMVFTRSYTAKNICLAGVKSVTIYDPEPVKLRDLSSQVCPHITNPFIVCEGGGA